MTPTRAGVLEIQCFYDNEMKYLVKEMSVYDLNHHSSTHWIFKPPERGLDYEVSSSPKTRRVNEWVVRNLHRIPWEAGEVNFEESGEIFRKIFSSFDLLYVKGLQKLNFLKTEAKGFPSPPPMFVNLEDLGCPKIAILLEPNWMGSHCLQHNSEPTRCTTYKLKGLVRWFLNRI